MTEGEKATLRQVLRERALASGPEVVAMTQALLRENSETPPSATRAVCEAARVLVETIPGIAVALHESAPPVVNMTAHLVGGPPGPRLILSGHIDTYPIGELGKWTADPFAGEVREGFLYGRGSCDMKGGIAAAIMAMRLIAETGKSFPGEIVLALAGDEESMGERGTQAMIDTVPECHGDAVIIPDVGSPNILRIGEKGMIWLRLEARGKAAHGAHVHRGENAIDTLVRALLALKALEDLRMDPSHPALRTMDAARTLSEPLGGTGEYDTMSRVTVNIGTISGGTSPNLVADSAFAELDIRIPAGVTSALVEAEISRHLAAFPSLSMEVTRRYEPSWTDAADPLVNCLEKVAGEVLATPVTVNMRAGASDARLWRRAGLPTVVCGLTPYNLGAPDEKLDLSELPQLTAVLTLAVFDYLHEPR